MAEMAIPLKTFLAEARDGRFDLPPMQRTLRIGARFAARLMDSLFQGLHPGSLLIWEPPVGERPSGGRYASDVRPRYWILDGQQRGTAYLGAFGLRPNWVPQQQWAALGGPMLEVAVHLPATGRVEFVSWQRGRSRCIRLADLWAATDGDRQLLESAGCPPRDELVDVLKSVRTELLGYRLTIEWLEGDRRKAAENFVRRNPNLRPEERALCRLSIVCEDLQRGHIDALAERAVHAGLGVALDRKRINVILQAFLRREVHGQRGRPVDADAVLAAAVRTEQAVDNVLGFLHQNGVVCDALLWSHPVTQVLAALFDRFPQAVGADFTWRWLAHAAALQFYPGGPAWQRAGQDTRLVLDCGTFEQAQAVLYRHAVAGTSSSVGVGDVDGSTRAGHKLWGGAATVYAMACGHQSAGPVVDLVDPTLVFPDRRMQPRVLWPGAGRSIGMAQRAFLSQASADTLAVNGGWGRGVFEAADISPGILAAHQLTVPRAGAPEAGEQLVKRRAKALTEVINRFLEQVGPVPHTQIGGEPA